MVTEPLVDSRTDETGMSFTYPTVKLKDGNIWTAKNFNYFTGEEHCQTWAPYFESKAESRIGGLYYGWTVLTPKVLPPGWHLPTWQEYQALIDAYGGGEQAFDQLTKGGASGLNLELTGGTYLANQSCIQLSGNNGFFWSGSIGNDNASAAILQLSTPKKIKVSWTRMGRSGPNENRFAVRLIKDSSSA